MVKALILYYLSVKETHGYEIQRFVEFVGIDKWAKVKSGSIYYALASLEKDGFIDTVREERTGARVRKIYGINKKGEQELVKLTKEELLKPIWPVESEKFESWTFINKLPKEEVIELVNKHIEELKAQVTWWKQGKEVKVLDNSTKLDILTFDISITNLENQIKWHEALLEELDKCMIISGGQENLIKSIAFEEIDDKRTCSMNREFQKNLDIMKKRMKDNPDQIDDLVNQIVNLLKNQNDN
ncbi:PadR family transcriptional regulator [Inconstantimicrobium mannanitabidum]|uniref:PadR family transcriptional regulator n=1 Tax=Inconstantimicrobium mannanitabidum TaxID=1604901 RepID=A0ACB5RFQ4_9CLOT|nr:PadR family transcriptional regulator [Clostridium sp. TW13]GKX67909.1 PadR family transcriptional regulator [Clostridium sp. TW13]